MLPTYLNSGSPEINTALLLGDEKMNMQKNERTRSRRIVSYFNISAQHIYEGYEENDRKPQY
jgi:hypothetical protein